MKNGDKIYRFIYQQLKVLTPRTCVVTPLTEPMSPVAAAKYDEVIMDMDGLSNWFDSRKNLNHDVQLVEELVVFAVL